MFFFPCQLACLHAFIALRVFYTHDDATLGIGMA